MENFILYEEIGRGKNSIVYKGRRKGTIKFLAILCIEKNERAAITNWVRLVHEIEHDNIVKFYEWYETSNHLWMVVELCTGGPLQEILTQDGYLPEKTICNFGRDILLGLSYLHERGIVFADLCPKKVLLDGPGNLKLTNFCISRLHDENLGDIYAQATPEENKLFNAFDLKGTAEYQAPEVCEGKELTLASDIWSFGILLYQLYAGSLPFSSLEASKSMQNKDNYELPKIKRKSFNRQIPQDIRDEKPSENFSNLLQSILQKDPEKRPTTQQLLKHSFWRTEDNGQHSDDPKTDFAAGDTFVKSITRSSLSIKKDEAGDRTTHLSITPETVNVLDSTFTLSSRPHTAGLSTRAPDGQTPRPMSARPRTPLNDTKGLNKMDILGKSQNKRPISAISVKTSIVDSLIIHEDICPVEQTPISQHSMKELIYHDSDFELSVIQDNPQVRKVESLKYDAKSLTFQVLSTLDQATPDEIYNHLKQVSQALNQPSSTNYLRSKINVLLYLSQMCTSSVLVANHVINSPLLGQLATIVKSSMQQSSDLACKAARSIGLAASSATELEHCTRICDVFTVLMESLRENFRNTRAKLALLPCIGQLLYLIAEQEDASLTPDESHSVSQQRNNWSIPSSTYSLITKSLREGEDPTIQHYACKIIEAVTTVTGQHGKRFITASAQGSVGQSSSHSDVIGPLLWTVAGRATNENLKLSALSALCRLNKLSGSGSVLLAAVDRAGVPALLSMLSRASFRCQQAIVTALVETLHSAPKGQATRLANGKDLLPNLMRLFDSPSSLVRTKLILAVIILLKKMPNMLVIACQLRLIMYIEREGRRVAVTSAGQNPSTNDYTQSCLSVLIKHVSTQAPLIATNCIAALDEAVVRKHPSSNQVKQLKQLLPTCLVLQHLVTSQVFRSQIVTSGFVMQLGLLLSHATVFLKKTSQSSSITSSIGDDIVQKFVDAVISIIECLSQHPLVLTQFAEASMTALVPNIITLLGAYGNENGKIVCIKLLTDVLGALLHYRAMSLDLDSAPLTPLRSPSSRLGSASSVRSARYRRQEVPDDYDMQIIIKDKLFPDFQSYLSSKDPLPAYAVRLLGSLLEHWPSLTTSLYSHGLVPTLMGLFNKQQLSNLKLYAQGVTTVLTYMIQYNDEKVVNQIYENGLIDTLGNYLSKTSKLYHKSVSTRGDTPSGPDVSSVVECLTQLLSLLKAMLDRVTVFVKEALQTPNASASGPTNTAKLRTENAEQLLISHKPLTELQSICIQILCSEHELHELSLACLSMFVQLFGGDHQDTLSAPNIACLAQTLTKAPPKRQRILLKLIKRVVTLNKCHADTISSPKSSVLVQTIRMVHDSAEKIADASVASLATEILNVASKD